jgi:hypothetical protein
MRDLKHGLFKIKQLQALCKLIGEQCRTEVSDGKRTIARSNGKHFGKESSVGHMDTVSDVKANRFTSFIT